MEKCTVCPRACRVNRSAGTVGICTQDAQVRLARAALHMWEEPPISGEEGSGTVFFSGCNLQCVYCQNHEISNGSVGKAVSIERLAEIFIEQQGRGANNINLVTPSHFVPQILEALKLAKGRGLSIPIVYNCGGYESADSIASLKGFVDVFLTDFKYSTASLAAKYSKAPDYPEVASQALDSMFDLVGKPSYDQKGHITSGIIVRHLLLPDGLLDSFGVIRFLASKPYAHDIRLSLMSQYTPLPHIDAGRFPELTQNVDPDDYEALINYAQSWGFEDIYIQDGSAAEESFIPAFDYEGV